MATRKIGRNVTVKRARQRKSTAIVETIRVVRLIDDINQFLKDSGLQENIARKIEEASRATDDSEGISNNES